MQKKTSNTWSVWIDEIKKVISFKEIPNAKQMYYENKEDGIKAVSSLVSKGYKIG